MFIETSKLNNIIIITPHEDIIRENSEDIEHAVMQNCGKHITDVVIDCKKVHYINSFALGILVKIHQHLEENQCALHFVNVAPSIKTLFKITRVLEYFSLLNSIDELPKKLK